MNRIGPRAHKTSAPGPAQAPEACRSYVAIGSCRHCRRLVVVMRVCGLSIDITLNPDDLEALHIEQYLRGLPDYDDDVHRQGFDTSTADHRCRERFAHAYARAAAKRRT